MLSDEQQRRLKQEKKSFEQSYKLQSGKIDRLRNAWIIETDPSHKFQYEQQIKQEENELRGLTDRLNEIEKQLESVPSVETDYTKRLWNIPYSNNPYFTGRKETLERLSNYLSSNKIAALTGLGGVGKTQIALQYVYTNANQYKAIFWLNSGTDDGLFSGFIDIANQLAISERASPSQDDIVRAVNRWLENNNNWLLIFNDADKPEFLKRYHPSYWEGHILITSRKPTLEPGFSVSEPIEIDSMSLKDAVEFLFKRTKRLEEDDSGEREAAKQLAIELGCLPLALEQAGAYIDNRRARFEEYLLSYRKRRLKLLRETKHLAGDYRKTVATTWSFNFHEVESESKAAAELLRASAFFNADSIPLKLIAKGSVELGSLLAKELSGVQEEPLILNEVLAPLINYSLVSCEIDINTTYSVHRLVQEVIKEDLNLELRSIWSERIVRNLNQIFPSPNNYKNWLKCELLMPHVSSALQLIKTEKFNFLEASYLLNRSGRYLYERAQYRTAAEFYEQSLTIQIKILGEAHPDLIECVNNLVELYDAEGRFKDAEALAEKSFTILQNTDNPNVIQLANSLHNLGLVYESQGRYNEAIPHYEKAFDLKLKTLGELHLDVAQTLNNLAKVNYSIGQYKKAESLHKKALEIRIKLSGQEAPIVAQSFDNLGMLYEDMESYAKSEENYRKAQHIFEKILGKEHPFLAMNLDNLARLFSVQGQIEQSEKFSTQALEIWQKTFNLEHPFAAYSLSNLGQLRSIQEQYSEAEKLYNQALNILSKTVGLKHPEFAKVINNLAYLYTIQGDAEKAINFYKQAINIQRKALPKHPDYAKTLNNLALSYMSLSHFDKAEKLFERAKKININSLGSDNIAVVLNINNLAFLYGATDKFTEAKTLYEQAINICEKKLEVDNPLYIQILKNYSELLHKLDAH